MTVRRPSSESKAPRPCDLAAPVHQSVGRRVTGTRRAQYPPHAVYHVPRALSHSAWPLTPVSPEQSAWYAPCPVHTIHKAPRGSCAVRGRGDVALEEATRHRAHGPMCAQWGQAIAWGRGGGRLGCWPAPTDRPTSDITTIFLGKHTQSIKGAANWRPISGTQTFVWPLTHPPPGGRGVPRRATARAADGVCQGIHSNRAQTARLHRTTFLPLLLFGRWTVCVCVCGCIGMPSSRAQRAFEGWQRAQRTVPTDRLRQTGGCGQLGFTRPLLTPLVTPAQD